MAFSSATQSTNLYVADPRADIVVRSSNGIDFLVRRAFLEVHSEVFDAMFATASEDVGEKDPKTNLPVVKLVEKGEHIDLFLRLIVGGQIKPVFHISMSRRISRESSLLLSTKNNVH